MGINEQFFSSYIQGQYERAISQLYILIFVGKKIEIIGNYLLRITLDTLHALSKLFASARYTVKTLPDELLNLCIENIRNKFTPKNTVGQRSHDDEIDKVLQIQTPGLMLKLFELENLETTLQYICQFCMQPK